MSLTKVSKRQLTAWLEDVTAWQELNGLEQLTNIMNNLKVDDLVAFLHNLEFTLRAMLSVTEALEQLPSVGQLLGRLCAIPSIIWHQPVYIALMKCILWFAMENPCTQVEKRAKAWAMALLRSAMKDKNGTNHVLLHTGYTQNKCYTLVTKEILNGLASQLVLPKRQWCSKLQCYIPVFSGNTQLPDSDKLLNIFSFCLHNYQIAVYRNLMDVLAQSLGASADETLQQKVSEKLAAYQHDVMTGKQHCGLSYQATQFLWCTRLPALEEAVLDMLEGSWQEGALNQGRLLQLMEERYLVKLMKEESYVSHVVMSMLETLLPKSQFEELKAKITKILNSNQDDWR